MTQSNQSDHYLCAVSDNSGILQRFERSTSRIPWLGKQEVSARAFLIGIAIASVLAFALFTSGYKSERNILTETTWCVDTVMVNGVTRLQPNTLGLYSDFSRGRSETLQLRKDGTVILPGFNSEAVHAKWRTEEIYIEIYDADTFGNIYNNVYEFYITPEFLKLVSEDVMISTSRKGAF
jgi:hypothetical protein